MECPADAPGGDEAVKIPALLALGAMRFKGLGGAADAAGAGGELTFFIKSMGAGTWTGRLAELARALRARTENKLSFVMNFSIVTLFNEKAEPAELHFWGFGVRKNVAGLEFGNSGSANSITGLNF